MLRSNGADLPQVTVKWAQTLDGRIATASGSSQWITGLAARREAHRLRARHDAIVVGVGTVLADDPQLTVRLAPGPDPLRVILDSRLRSPAQARVARPETLFATLLEEDHPRAQALVGRGARVERFPQADGRVDLAAVLTSLQALGIRRVFVEGGAGVVSECLRRGFASRCAVFIAPKISGAGRNAVQLGDRAEGPFHWQLTDVDVMHLDGDIMISARIRYARAGS